MGTPFYHTGKSLWLFVKCPTSFYNQPKIKNPYKKDIPYNEIVNSLPDDVRVDYMGSMDLDPKYSDIGSVEGAVLQKAKQADAVIIFSCPVKQLKQRGG